MLIFLNQLIAISDCLPLQRPVIGVFTMDSDYEGQYGPQNNYTYIATSYIKWIQMAGAQVVPIRSYSSKDELKTLWSKINGILFPGGQMPIDINTTWIQNFQYLVNLSIEANQKGDVFPIWSTCLGYEVVAYLFNRYQFPLSLITDQNATVRPMTFLSNKSAIFNTLSESVIKKIQSVGLYYFNHRYVVRTEDFNKYTKLNQAFDLIAVSTNIKNVQFVAFMQHKTLPIFGAQYHPQKNNFQFRIDANRTFDGIVASQNSVNKFMEVARMNTHSFESLQELQKNLVYNTRVVVHSAAQSPFCQEYFFKENLVKQNIEGQRTRWK